MNDRRPHRTREPARARPGTIDRRAPRDGTEPVTARSALRLRLLLSGVFLPLFAAGAAFFAQWAADTGAGDSPARGTLVVLAVVCAAFVLLAAADLLVVNGRLRREREEVDRYGPRGPEDL